jgi:PQQ system protein
VSETDVFDVASLNRQNGIALGRVLGSGTVAEAEEAPDGKMTGTIRIPEDELVYEPGILVMLHGGTIELTIINDDKNTHCAVMPSNGDTQFLWLVNHSKRFCPCTRRNAGSPVRTDVARSPQACWCAVELR